MLGEAPSASDLTSVLNPESRNERVGEGLQRGNGISGLGAGREAATEGAFSDYFANNGR